MDKITASVIVLGILALSFVAFFAVFRSRGKGKLKGPFGTIMEVEGSNETGPAVKVEGAKSRSGGLIAADSTGGGAEVKDVEVEKNIRVTSSIPPTTSPKAMPPRI